MSSDLWAALRSLPQRGDHVLTLLRRSSPLIYWASRDGIIELYRRAGLAVPKKPWHALRHSFASQLVSAGVPLRQVQEWLGHSTMMMTMRYAHLAPGSGDAIRALDCTRGAHDEESSRNRRDSGSFEATPTGFDTHGSCDSV